MNKKNFIRNFLLMFCISALVVLLSAVLSNSYHGRGKKDTGISEKNAGVEKENNIIKLNVFNQYSSYAGEQTGWSAELLKNKFGIRLNITPEFGEDTIETNNLYDIIICDSTGKYPQAVKTNLLLDWEKDGIISNYGSYIKENMSTALEKNRELTRTITKDESNALYGFGNNIALSWKDHEVFFYTWDCRWDLYQELGYPEIRDLDDLAKLLKEMQKLCPKDDAGNKTYAVSLWPDWDEENNMLMYAGATATAYYGYDRLALGLYDSQTGNYHDVLEKDGPYLEMLKFYNTLYQNGLLDPDSRTQNYEQVLKKAENGTILFSIFNYMGSAVYNTEKHLQADKMMYCMKPANASPIVYGLNTQGGDHIWSISAKSKHPDKAMEFINYLCTPEGRMTMEYGPQGITWDYDEDKHPYLTKLGRKCQNDMTTSLEGSGYNGTFLDGILQINNTTWALDAENPDSNGDTYNQKNWSSKNTGTKSKIEQDWCDKTGANDAEAYLESGKYVIQPYSSYSPGKQNGNLEADWHQVTTSIIENSWNAIYAKTDKEFNKIILDMQKQANEKGYKQCKKWSQKEAVRKKKLEDALK